MSPEQAAGTSVDARTDIYALGVILYELVSGRCHFDADNIMGILTQHMIKAPTPFRDLESAASGCARRAGAVIFKALSKKPEQRYQTMDALAHDLDQVVRGGAPTAVAEMIARSAGFNVPADFFKNLARPARESEIPAGIRPTRTGMYAELGVAVVAIALIAFLSTKSSKQAPAPAPLRRRPQLLPGRSTRRPR